MNFDVKFQGQSFNVTVDKQGFNFKKEDGNVDNADAKFVLECLNTNKELRGKTLGRWAGIKQSWHVNHLLKKAAKGKTLSEKEQAKLTKIGTKVLAYIQAEGLTTKDGKGNMILNKAACHKRHKEKVTQENQMLESLSASANSISQNGSLKTIGDVALWNLSGWNYRQEAVPLSNNCLSLLNTVRALQSNSNDRSSLRADIVEAGNLAYQVVSKLNVLDKALPSDDSDKQKFSEAKDSFVQLAGQIKQLADQCSVDLPGLKEVLQETVKMSKEKAQTKLDQLTAKQEECNKKFDALCARHQAALDAFSTLDEDDQNFKDKLNEAVTGFEGYKTEQLDWIDATMTITEHREEIEKLGSGNVPSGAKICESIDSSIKLLDKNMPAIFNKFGVQTWSDLRDSACDAFGKKIRSFQNDINAKLEQTETANAQDAQTAESWMNAMAELSPDKKLPAHIQTLYDDFAKASQEVENCIQATRKQAESIAEKFRGVICEFNKADVRSPDAIKQFADKRENFPSYAERVRNNSIADKNQQKECKAKLSALKAELMKTPEGCQVLMDAHKAQMDQSIGVFEKAVELAKDAHWHQLMTRAGVGFRPEVQALPALFEQFQKDAEQMKQNTTQAYNHNAINLNEPNGEFAKSYETFEGVCQESQSKLDEMLQSLESQCKSASFSDWDWKEILAEARGLPSEES